MKVLISAGLLTNNIVAGINKKLESGGIDFLVVPFIEDIGEIYQRGEYFDRAVILEQSWTHDFQDQDEGEVREHIHQFTNDMASRNIDNISFVFLAQEESTGEMVYDEILPIQSSSVVLVKQPRYSITFFKELVTTEITKMPDELVYKPTIITNDVDQVHHEEFDDTPVTPEYNPDYEGDIEKEIGTDGELFNGNKLEMGAGMDFGNDPEQFETSEQAGEQFGIWDDDFDKPVDSDIPEGDPVDPDDPDFSDIPNDRFETGDIPDMGGDVVVDDGFDFTSSGEEHHKLDLEKHEDIPEQPFIPQTEQYPNEETFDNSRQAGEIPDYTGEDPEFTGDQSGDMGYQQDDGAGYQEDGAGYQEEQYEDPEQFHDENQNGAANQDYNPDYDNYNNQPMQGDYGTPDYESEYTREPDIVAPIPVKQNNRVDLSNSQIKATLDAFANRGNSILVTGCGGCGTSTIALNLANVINNLGYTVLLVDLDTMGKTQSYISKDNYDCIEPESAGLRQAVNSTSGINAHIAIVRQGFHLLTMGLASDAVHIDKILEKNKLLRFMNLAKTSHNFVIYDVPFETAIGFGQDFTFMADNLVITVDCSNWGITKTMINLTNIDNEDMRETLFNKGQLLFNRYRALNKVMGRKVKTAIDITKAMDYKSWELLGEDPGYYFQSMHICGLINEDARFESGWYESTQYSDTKEGNKMFLELLKNIVLKR